MAWTPLAIFASDRLGRLIGTTLFGTKFSGFLQHFCDRVEVSSGRTTGESKLRNGYVGEFARMGDGAFREQIGNNGSFIVIRIGPAFHEFGNGAIENICASGSHGSNTKQRKLERDQAVRSRSAQGD